MSSVTAHFVSTTKLETTKSVVKSSRNHQTNSQNIQKQKVH